MVGRARGRQSSDGGGQRAIDFGFVFLEERESVRARLVVLLCFRGFCGGASLARVLCVWMRVRRKGVCVRLGAFAF